MTCVVFRDGIIASDSKIISRSWTAVAGYQKVGARTHDGKVYLFGATGETAYAAKFERWMNSDEFVKFIESNMADGHPNLEPSAREEQCTGLIFTPENACIRIEGNYPAYLVEGDYFAFGTGDMVAIGAFHHGATAMEAVQAAIDHDVLSNGPILMIDRKDIQAKLELADFKAA